MNTLFLGFLLDPLLKAKLGEVPTPLKSLLIQEGPDYLQQIKYQDQLYLGKKLGSILEWNALDLTKKHLLSLLTKLVGEPATTTFYHRCPHK